MVQLSTLPPLDSTPPPEQPVGRQDAPDWSLSEGPSMQHSCLDVSTAYYGYDSYIEDGLICLKHKVRNLEKKKQKLDGYKKRMVRGEALNKDQLVAVEKYEEVLHNITFARELHRILDGLTQNLLKAQQQAVKKEQLAASDMERKRLTLVLQLQQLLGTLQLEQVQKDLLLGQNQAPHIPAHKLHSLKQLAALLGIGRNSKLSCKQQAAEVYLDLLEGKDQPVAGSSFQLLKEELIRLLHCSYFTSRPSPPKHPQMERSRAGHSDIWRKSKAREPSTETLWRPPADGNTALEQCQRSCETLDSWDMDFSDQQLKRKMKAEPSIHPVDLDLPIEVFCSTRAFPRDPVLRQQNLEELLMKMHGSFSFMQESLLDTEDCPYSGPCRLDIWPSRSPSVLAQKEMGPAEVQPSTGPAGAQPSTGPAEVQPSTGPAGIEPSTGPAGVEPSTGPAGVEPSTGPAGVEPSTGPAGVEPSTGPAEVQPSTGPEDKQLKPIHSTPLSARRRESRARFSIGAEDLGTCDLDFLQKRLPHEPLQLSGREMTPSPPLHRIESNISVGVDIQSHLQPLSRDLRKPSPGNGAESCSTTTPQGPTFSTPPSRRSLASTQFETIQSVFSANPPKPTTLKLKPDSVFSETKITVGTQTPAEFALSEDDPQSDFQRDEVDCNGGQVILLPGQLGGGPSTPPHYTRGSVRAPWINSSLMSSPDWDRVLTVLDSGLGDSMRSLVEGPLSPQSHGGQADLVSMQLFPLLRPLRAAFTASRTVNFAPGNLDQPIVFDQLHSNVGGVYDAHVGRFTCPASGSYVFIFHILKLAVNVPLYVNLMRNDEVVVSAYANDGTPDHETASNHAILPLLQGDQVWLRLHRGAIYGSTWKFSTFSGFLLYQD